MISNVIFFNVVLSGIYLFIYRDIVVKRVEITVSMTEIDGSLLCPLSKAVKENTHAQVLDFSTISQFIKNVSKYLQCEKNL